MCQQTQEQNKGENQSINTIKEQITGDLSHLSLGESFKLIMNNLKADQGYMESILDKYIDQVKNSSKEEQIFDFEMHGYLKDYLVQHKQNQKVKTLLVKIVSIQIDQGQIQSLEDLLMILNIELFSEAKDIGKIKYICKAIKMKNPSEVVDYLNTQYTDLLPPSACGTVEVLKDQLRKICSIDVYKNLDKILQLSELNGLTNILELCNLNEKELKELQLKHLDANYLYKYLNYYKDISVPFKICMKTEYYDISQLTVEQLLFQLEQQVNLKEQAQDLKLWYKFKEQLCAMKLCEVIDFQILKQNRFERQNEMYKVKDVCRQLDLRQFKAEMSLFSKACLKYSQLYDNILIINFADSNENITLYYVGWQIHWETVIDFVQSHILSDSYQPFDLLCSLGDPRSGKTSSMELSAIFMSFFVHMIRPQCKNDFFCQNFTKIIRIDCLQFVTYELIGKLERIYELILLSIPQTQQQILTFQSHVKLKNVPAILGSIQDMFVKAKCYFVVNWDEAQTLNYVQDQSDTKNITNISKKDQIALGQFYKNVMICINSPCQHLMAASLSVALLSILSAIPVNGRGIMRCNQAIVTSFQDDDSMLLCVNNLVHRKEKERQTILQCAKAVLLLTQMTYTCANLDQIISRLDKCKGLTENQIQEIIYNTAVQIKRNKTLIAQEWLDQICNMADSNMEIFEYIAGTTRVPGDLLIKLCIRSINENGQIQFKLRDQSVLTALVELSFRNQDLEYYPKLPTFLTNTCLKQFVVQKGIQGSEQYHVDSCLIGHKVAFVSLMCNFLTSIEECYIDFL
ncbi:Hypothetical_protein [Hexamita inflata]|uniref:Hypothetical_protein n=1 Tax=Hexamita inflata TaxID=28002 RepID=A0AA86R1S3_9EUKA|nr:Hypothetical protein HINF_LOCUS57786 [Hexamita inflata]